MSNSGAYYTPIKVPSDPDALVVRCMGRSSYGVNFSVLYSPVLVQNLWGGYGGNIGLAYGWPGLQGSLGGWAAANYPGGTVRGLTAAIV